MDINTKTPKASGGWGQALGGIGGAFLGMLGAGQQHRRQKELMDIQNRNQQALNKQGHDLQFDMWNKTNAKAQVEHYKQAGLNPALMYGQSGAGGQTGSQGGGSAAGGQAPLMDIGANAMQGAMMKAQIDNIKADTENKQANTTKTGGADTEHVETLIQKLIAETNNESTKQELNKVLIEVQKGNVLKVGAETGLLKEKLLTQKEITGLRETENEVAWATKEDKKAIIQMEAKLQGLKGEKTKQEIENLAEQELVLQLKQAEQRAGVELTNEQREAIWHKTWQGWMNSGFNGLTKIIEGIMQFKPKSKTSKSYKEGVRNGKKYWETVDTTIK